MMFSEELKEKLYECGAIATLVIDDLENAVPVAKALLDGGIWVMELTLRTPVAMNAMLEIKKQLPEMTIGMGTVLTTEQVKQVSEAGADFAVSPGLNPNVVKAAIKYGLPFAPGIVTPSDIELAVELGCKFLKYFPAEPSGGLKYLKSMAAPYNHLGLKYLPLGGLNQNNFGQYIEDPLILAVGGSWIAKREFIKNKEWEKIKENARQAAELVKKIRG